MYVEGKQSVLIIGGGIFGLSTALSLLSSGHSVTVFDKSPLPAIDAASTDISKVIRLDYGHSKIYTTLAYLSILQWLEWNKQTKDVLGDETKLFDQCGGVFANKGIGEFEFAKHTFQCLESLGISNDISAPENFQNGAFVNLSVNQHNRQIHQQTLQSRFPKWSNPILNSSLSGYVQPTAGWANAELSMKFVIEKLKRLGCKFVTGFPAGCFDSFIHSSTSSSTVIGIRTADGHSHFGDKILVACGAWTASVLPEIDSTIRAHMMPVIHFRIPTSKKDEWEGKNFPVWLVNDEENDTLIYGFPVNDSSLLKIAIDNSGYINPVSPNHPPSSSPPRPSSTPYTILDNSTPVLPSKSISYFLTFLADTFPGVLQFDVENIRMCWYCNSIDYGFIIDEVPGKENVWVATGGSGHGISIFLFTPSLLSI
ncbi:FAD dependent oxidoreductase [Paraphysoderma sedebokerense]|nr:FAD dependent oxidoreductase [Paraphysoderma sedebokerense]